MVMCFSMHCQRCAKIRSQFSLTSHFSPYLVLRNESQETRCKRTNARRRDTSILISKIWILGDSCERCGRIKSAVEEKMERGREGVSVSEGNAWGSRLRGPGHSSKFLKRVNAKMGGGKGLGTKIFIHSYEPLDHSSLTLIEQPRCWSLRAIPSGTLSDVQGRFDDNPPVAFSQRLCSHESLPSTLRI